MQTNTLIIFRLFLCLFVTTYLPAQTLAPKNQKLFGGTGGERIYAIKPTTDNGLIFAGVTNSWLGDGDVDDFFRRQNGRFPQVDGNSDVWVVKLASDYKTIQWQRVIGGSQYDNAQSVLQTSDGNYMIAGYSYSPNDGDVNGHHACDAVSPTCRDGWVVKLRGTDGAIMWSKCYGGSGDDNFYGIQPTNDGGYLLAGYTASLDGDVTGFHDGTNNNNDGFGDAWLVKIDTSGKILWQKTVGGTLKDVFSSLTKTQDGGFIAAGYTNSSDFDLLNIKTSYNREAWIVKLDTSGRNIVWQNIASYPNNANIDSRSYSVKQTKKGEYVLGGTTAQIPYKQDGMGNIDMDVFIAKFSTTGVLKWKKSYGGTDDDWGTNIISLDADDGVIVSGYTFSSDGDVTNYRGLRDGWVVRCDSLGNKIATATIGGGDFDYIYTSTIDNFGKIILAGATKSHDSFVPGNFHGDTDAWFFELDTNGICNNVGTPCNDNNPQTVNDAVQSDCICRGTPTVLTVANCPQPITVNAVPNTTYALVTWINPTATTTCTNGLVKIAQTAGLANGAAFQVGTQNVTYNITDSCTNAKICNFIVTVNPATSIYNCPVLQKNFGDACNDNNPNTINDVIQTDCTCKGTPAILSVINCPTPITITAVSGSTNAVVFWTTPTASTTCTNGLTKITQTLGNGSGTAFPVGISTITYAVKDSCANTQSCSFTITIKAANTFDCPILQKNIGDVCDDGNPNTINDKIQADCSCKGTPKQSGALTLTCPPNITVSAAANAAGATATWNDPTAVTTCTVTGTSGTGICIAGNFAGFTSLGKFGSSNYYLSTASNQWDNAKNICQINGGHLVTISTQAENDFVSSKIGASNAVFIGLSDKNGTGTYTWADGTTNTYINWDGGIPNNNGASLGNYAAMLGWSAGRWSNQNKYVAKQFVMEIECGGSNIALTQTAGGAKGTTFPLGTQTVTYQATDSCANLQTCSFTVTVIPVSTVGADIAVRFQNVQTSFVRYSTFHYILEAKNSGGQPMTNVVIQFKYPVGTVNGGTAVPSVGTWQTYCSGGVLCYQWTIPSLAVNSIATLDAPVFVLNTTTPVVATAQLLSSTPTDTNPANDAATLILSPPLNLTAANAAQTIPIVIEKLYPNPVTEELDIKLNSLVDKDLTFRFFNSLGTATASEKRRIEKGENILRFDVSNWQNGVYYLLPDIQEGINAPVKFIKLE